MCMNAEFAITAIVDGQKAYLQLTGYGRVQFKMRKDQLTFARLRAKGGEIVGKYDATLMNDQAAKNMLDTLVKHADLYPEMHSPQIISV